MITKVNVKKFIEALRKCEVGKTYDICDENGEGWHGFTKSYEFDGESILFGYYGGGVDGVVNLYDEDFAPKLREYIEVNELLYFDWEGNEYYIFVDYDQWYSD